MSDFSVEYDTYMSRLAEERIGYKGKCGGCVRCEERGGEDETGYHCTMQKYDMDIGLNFKACKFYWDIQEELADEKEELIKEEKFKRRNLKNPTAAILLKHDGFGISPVCPSCGDFVYDTEKCLFCGQKLFMTKEVEDFFTPEYVETVCFVCGEKGIAEKSKYNGHLRYHCNKCGTTMME